MDDQIWMRQALKLATRGRGAVEPNPLVGAVVVRDGVCLGEGWHQRFGGPHAEIHALANVADPQGATLYVTLEPCCHHGKTPPCTEAILLAGIQRVVYAMADPFPQVSGQGAERLRQAGLEVQLGPGENAARRLNAPYLKLLSTHRPWVIAKWAMTIDGKIATRSGDSKWISNPASRRLVHTLRGQVDAILVGIGTVLADDPLLTARPAGPRLATRIVLDSRLRLPIESQLVRTAGEAPTLVVTTRLAPVERRDTLRSMGCEVLIVADQAGRPSLLALLDELGRRRFTNLLIEGGGEILGSALDAQTIDEVHIFVAPKLAGGAQARSPILGQGVEHIADALALADLQVEFIEGDVHLHGRKDKND